MHHPMTLTESPKRKGWRHEAKRYHPDTNGGDHSKVHLLHRALRRRVTAKPTVVRGVPDDVLWRAWRDVQREPRVVVNGGPMIVVNGNTMAAIVSIALRVGLSVYQAKRRLHQLRKQRMLSA